MKPIRATNDTKTPVWNGILVFVMSMCFNYQQKVWLVSDYSILEVSATIMRDKEKLITEDLQIKNIKFLHS